MDSVSLKNQEIVCFKHCEDCPIFCKEVPQTCPICEQTIADFSHGPFQLPNPFSNAREKPVSIVIRPSSGSFLDPNYGPKHDLHIGLVSSKGEIFEYDQRGCVFNDFMSWRNCLSFENIVPDSWCDHWDEVLGNLMQSPRWKADNYHPVNFNCFDFILAFITELNYKELQFEKKEDICRDLVLPKMRDSLRYISIYNNLRRKNCYFLRNEQ